MIPAARLELWIWVLIYAGLIGVGLGVVIARNGAPLGIGIAIGGGVVAAVGVVLIWVRSRMNA